MRRALVLFNQAMRWHDNLLLSEQAEFDQLIAVVLLDPADYLTTQYGMQRAGIQRLQAQLKLLLNWQQQWQQKQQLLHIRVGPTDLCLQQLAKLYGADTLIAAEPTAPEQYQELQHSGLKLKLFDINSLLQHQLRPDLATLPKSFSAFRREREPDLYVQPPQQLAVSAQFYADPSLVVDTTALDFISRYHQPTAALFNEAAALERLMQFIWQQQAVRHYKQSRDALDGEWNSSLWSFYLANGTLSPC